MTNYNFQLPREVNIAAICYGKLSIVNSSQGADWNGEPGVK